MQQRYSKNTRIITLSGLKPLGPLNLDNNIAMNWKNLLQMYKICAIVVGISNKAEQVQCCVFLHVAETGAKKGYRALNIDSAKKDKIVSLINAFTKYCEGKTNITV